MLLKNKITIGTAQFGLNYGIANKAGVVKISEILKILNFAKKNNIKSLDTANLYGKSEKYLGNFNLNQWEVTTKIPKIYDFTNIGNFFDQTINESIKNLKIKKFENILLHYPHQLLSQNKKQIIFNLELLKETNKTNKVGLAINDISQLREILSQYTPDIVQLPLNIFDRRSLNIKFLEFLKKRNIKVHFRSIFLQGLLLMSINEHPMYFNKWKDLFKEMHFWLSKNNFSLLQGCLGIIKEVSYYDKIIFGINSKIQLEQILYSLNAKLPEMPKKFSSTDINLISPSLWKLSKNDYQKYLNKIEKNKSIILKKRKIDLLAIIQVRTGSTRLPNKILKKINGKTITQLIVERLSNSKNVNKIVLAISKKNCKSIVMESKKLKVEYFLGNENNVLERFYLVAKKYKPKYILRITGDCPLIDPFMIDKMYNKFKIKKLDYYSNIDPHSFPNGFDAEIFKFNVLKKTYKMAKKPFDLEHVTPFIKQSGLFKCGNYKNNENFSKIHLSLDDINDYNNISNIFNHFKPNIFFSCEDVIKLIKNKKLNIIKQNSGNKLWQNAKKIIPGGCMLYSKRQENFLPGDWPTYFSKAKGCKIWDLDNNKYYDVSMMGIGTNVLGYANIHIDNAVINSIKNSNMSTLNSPHEVMLAEKLIELHPWFEMVRFARTGGEANSIAIRIARAASKKVNIAVCGYHGWHDWYLAANLNSNESLNEHLLRGLKTKGVPKKLQNTVYTFKYNDFKELEKIVKNKNIGIIKMEVFRNIKPKNNFLQKVRRLADRNKIILIFDECTSGFRETYGGLHKKFNVIPDMAIFGKTLGNGYAITAICGKKEVMDHTQDSFVSSTFWSEKVGFVAGLKCIEIMKKINSAEIILSKGHYIRKRLLQLFEKNKLKVKLSDSISMPSFIFESDMHNYYKTLITKLMLKKSYLASNIIYISTSHSKKIIDNYLSELENIFKIIRKIEKKDINKDEIENFKLASNTFERLN